MTKKQKKEFSTCAVCSVEITPENDSAEHIIPNAIGGRLKVKGFICESCNNTSGQNWESKLTSALNPLSVHFRIKRQKGISPPLKFALSDGTEYLLKHDGSISPARINVTESKISETQTEIHISAPNTKNLRKHLAGLKRKHPNLDIEKLLEKPTLSSQDLNEPIHFQLQFGGVEFGKSLVKSALAWASYNQIDVGECKTALNFLQNDNIPACYDYIFNNDVIIDRPRNKIFHCVAVSNDNPDNQLLAYIEYYNVYRLVIILSEDYKSDDIHKIYAINPLQGERINIEFNLQYSANELKNIFDTKQPKFNELKTALEDTLNRHNFILQNDKFHEKIISFENILDETLYEMGYDPNKILDEEEQLALSKRFAEEFIKKIQKQN